MEVIITKKSCMKHDETISESGSYSTPDTKNDESSSDFLQQIESFDPSGLATSLIEIHESTRITLQNGKEMIDIVTYEGILTEFLQRITDLVNRHMKTGEYGLEMENKNGTNKCN